MYVPVICALHTCIHIPYVDTLTAAQRCKHTHTCVQTHTITCTPPFTSHCALCCFTLGCHAPCHLAEPHSQWQRPWWECWGQLHACWRLPQPPVWCDNWVTRSWDCSIGGWAWFWKTGVLQRELRRECNAQQYNQVSLCRFVLSVETCHDYRSPPPPWVLRHVVIAAPSPS